jgi:hypothetical protein
MIGTSRLALILTALVSAAAACGDDNGGANGSNGSNGGTGTGADSVCPTYCQRQLECVDNPGATLDGCISSCEMTIFAPDDVDEDCERESDQLANCFEAASCDAIRDGSACETELGATVVACISDGSSGLCGCSQCEDAAMVGTCENISLGCEILSGSARDSCCQSALDSCSS